jgi:hypothetical protein
MPWRASMASDAGLSATTRDTVDGRCRPRELGIDKNSSRMQRTDWPARAEMGKSEYSLVQILIGPPIRPAAAVDWIDVVARVVITTVQRLYSISGPTRSSHPRARRVTRRLGACGPPQCAAFSTACSVI